MVKFVEDELKSIRQEILDMWTLVYDQMNNVCEAIPTVDKEKAWDVLIREARQRLRVETGLRHRRLPRTLQSGGRRHAFHRSNAENKHRP